MCMLRKTCQGTCILGKGILIMIDFDEEVAKFRPSMEIEKVKSFCEENNLQIHALFTTAFALTLKSYNASEEAFFSCKYYIMTNRDYNLFA